MRTMSTREIRAALTHIEEMLAEEGEVVITRRGRPVARLSAVAEAGPRPGNADLRSRMRRLAEGSEVAVREDREAR